MLAVSFFVAGVAAANCEVARRVGRVGQEELVVAASVLTQFSPLDRAAQAAQSQSLGPFYDRASVDTTVQSSDD
jgi:hypothetical protein